MCSRDALDGEVDRLRNIFHKNSYLSGVVENVIAAVLQPVMLRLPWIGGVSNSFRREIQGIVVSAVLTTKPVVCFGARHAFSGVHKDVLQATSRSHVIYFYKCCCEMQYVGKKTQLFSKKIKQHIPAKLISGKVRTRHIERCNSAITKHLKEHRDCIPSADEVVANRFQILASASNKMHLDILEAVFICALNPKLCPQREQFTRALHLT